LQEKNVNVKILSTSHRRSFLSKGNSASLLTFIEQESTPLTIPIPSPIHPFQAITWPHQPWRKRRDQGGINTKTTPVQGQQRVHCCRIAGMDYPDWLPNENKSDSVWNCDL